MSFSNIEIKTFEPTDLIGKTLQIKSYKDKSINSNIEIIVAIDTKTGELFVLKEMRHPIAK